MRLIRCEGVDIKNVDEKAREYVVKGEFFLLVVFNRKHDFDLRFLRTLFDIFTQTVVMKCGM